MKNLTELMKLVEVNCGKNGKYDSTVIFKNKEVEKIIVEKKIYEPTTKRHSK